MFRRMRLATLVALFLFCAVSAHAAITGVISGTLTDPTGAVIPKATITATNEATGVKQTAVSDEKGFYSFPVLDIGNYTVSTTVAGFNLYEQKGIHVDANSSVRTDIALVIGANNVITEVTANAVQVETQTTQMGDVIESTKITAVPLNGRAFTDLLALQPGVSPYSGKSENTSGGTEGGLNSGNVSINGGREASNGFMINGGDVNDGVQNGAAIIPNLDSISEFRIITNNFDAEYGNFSGGQVNVVTKNGTNRWHGSGFEFNRDTIFNARGYSFAANAPARGPYLQNIFGGTFGGPIHRDRIFFFGDYQGTRRTIGATEVVQTPTDADKTGNVSDMMAALPMNKTVVGSGWANVLGSRLGYTVQQGEPYYNTACTSTNWLGGSDKTGCVFPNANIPTKAWSPVPSHLFTYFPAANTSLNGVAAYTTSANPTTLTDNKEAMRVDVNSRFGTFFVYYFFDDNTAGNPYAGGTDGQFPAATLSRSQMSNVGLTTTFKNNSVNTFRFTYMRSATHSNNPTFQTPGPSLSSLGFQTPWNATGGIGNIYGPLAGVPQTSVDGMSFGEPTSTQAHIDNTFQWLDNYMKVIGTHTFQVGLNYHYDQINERNYYGVNGIYSFSDNQETGNGYADFLLGAPSSLTQASLQLLDSRSNYIGAYFSDSWRAMRSLTLNYGLRYEISTPWYDTQNKLETIIPGEQSKVFPGAPLGWVFPGDAGVARTLAPIRYNKFAPRFGFAYAPSGNGQGFFGKLFGSTGQSSIRGGIGLFYSNFQDESGFVEVGDAPYGLFYTSPNAPMFESPYIDRATQNIELPKFPFAFPPTNVSPSNPDNNIPWASLEPLSSSDAVGVNNTIPYVINFFVSVQRELGRNTVFSIAYSGNQGRHLANSEEANPGNAALCMSLKSSSQVKAGTTPCGPKLESQSYTRSDGTVVPGTRPLAGLAFGSNPYLLTAATSNFNSLQTNIRHNSKYWDVLLGYTWGKSLDDSSGLTDPSNPFNPKATYGLSNYDVAQYLVASFNVKLPFDLLTDKRALKQVIGGWAISGITKMATGTPISITDSDDYSLTGVAVADAPFYTPGNLFGGGLNGNKNPRIRNPASSGGLQPYPYFNTSLFVSEANKCKADFNGSVNVACYGTYVGNSRHRFIHGPGIDHTDLTLARQFHIHEGHNLTLRLEAFNFMNHAEFSNPGGASTTASSFGIISSPISGQARVLQVAAKYEF